MRRRDARWVGIALIAVVAARVMRHRRVVPQSSPPAGGRSTTSAVPSGTGQDAARPRDIPARGWLEIVRRTGAGMRRNQVPLLSAGVAFYAMLSLVPAMVAVVSV